MFCGMVIVQNYLLLYALQFTNNRLMIKGYKGYSNNIR